MSSQQNDKFDEPIAIIGMACRYPGEGSSPEKFWDMISNARTAHSPIPASRFNADAWYHPDPDRKGAIGVKSGFFIEEDLSLFDAPFFSMTAKEANTMDPMHRWILEVAYEGLENAGIPLPSLTGSDTGCFVGCFTQDYALMSNADIFNTGPYMATGSGATMLSNRVSWFFDLRGPSVSIDTACSSSIYALHLACQSIRTGEIKQAIVGGTNLLLYPDIFHSLSKMHMMSPDGKCHSFDDRANGYARGEGIGALIVKSLSAAIADGDTIRAVIRGTGCNQDGRTPGITMPSSQAQADLIRSTYAKSGLDLNKTAYFEAHGTGTPLGDPLELSALGATFGTSRSAEQPPLYVSSVKTNIGHTEGCSALAGIMKAVMSIEKGLIAPNAEFENLNPKLRLDDWGLALPPKTIPWPMSGIRRASVNSFGYGGANGHVILDDARSYMIEHGLSLNHMVTNTVREDTDSGFNTDSTTSDSEDDLIVNGNKIFSFSSFDQAGIQRLAKMYADFLSNKLSQTKNSEISLDLKTYADNLAYTLAARRTTFDCRSYAVASSLTQLFTALESGLPKIRRAAKNDNVIMVFTGQGAQWPRMGCELVAHPVFLQSLNKTQEILDSVGCTWNAVDELQKSQSSRINSADFSQPLCSALQIALVDLMAYWGIKPRAVIGHSSGEIGAAYACGAISHETAMKAAYWRGIYSADVNRRLVDASGAMMAVGVSVEEAEPYLNQVTSGKAVVACSNSPSSVTLSGDKSAILELQTLLKNDGKFARALNVPTAYHSHHMLTIADDYLNSMGEIQTIPASKDSPLMFSSVTGSLIQPKDLNAAYWVKNMVSQVRFDSAMKALVAHSPSARGRRRAVINYGAMIEVGPHEALKGPLNQILADIDKKLNSSITYVSLLARGKHADATAADAIGKLWSQGLTVDLQRVNLQADRFSHAVSLGDLPSYPWNHSKGFWHEPEMAKAKRFKKGPRTDLLGMPVDVQNALHPRWRNFLSIHENPWLEHHNITGTVLFPGAGMLIMALEAAYQIADKGRKPKGVEFRDMAFDHGLVIPENHDDAVEVSLDFQPHKLGNNDIPEWYRFTVFSLGAESKWQEHCSGLISIVYDEATEVDNGMESSLEWKAQTAEYKAIQARSTKKLDPSAFYTDLASVGMGYGELFANVISANAGEHCGHGTIVIPDTKSTMPYEYEFDHLIHPATLDAIFHLLFVGFNSGSSMLNAAVPVSMESMFIAFDLPKGAGATYHGYTVGNRTSSREGAGNIVVSDSEWSAPKIVIRNFAARDVTSAVSDNEEKSGKLFTRLRWMEDIEHFKGASAEEALETPGAEDAQSQLTHWLRLACHKRSDLSVLVLGGAESKLDIVRSFAPYAGRRDCFDQCTIVEQSEQLLNATQAKLDQDKIIATFKVADFEKPLTEQGFELKSFDLIITSTDSKDVLEPLVPLLRPAGHLVFSSAFGLDSVSVGLTGVGNIFYNDDQSSIIVSPAPVIESSESAFDEVVLLEPVNSSPALKALEEQLTSELNARGFKTTLATLFDAPALTGRTIISLLEAESPLVISFNEQELEHFKTLCTSNTFMLWVNRSSLSFAPSTGILRVIRTETPQICLPHFQVSTDLQLDSNVFSKLVLDIFYKTSVNDDEQRDMEYREEHGKILIPRLISNDSFDNELDLSSDDPRPSLLPLRQNERALKLTVSAPGSLDTILWIDDLEASTPLGEEEVEIEVTSSSLSAADLKDIAGDILAPVYGREAAGIVTRVGSKVVNFQPGQQVAALKQGTCSRYVRQHQCLVQNLSASSRIAGGLAPLDFVTAYYSAFELARLVEGERILIHSGASGLGQAAIQLAQYRGAELFVTVGSNTEKQLLVEHYSIPETHIFSSKDTTFAKGIKRMTQGHGVDVILNNTTSEIFAQTWSCIADFGRFIELGTKSETVAIDTERQVTYSKVNIEQLLAKKRNVVASTMSKVYEMINQGTIGQLYPITEFSITNAQKAFALLQSGKHMGKIVLKFDSDAQVPMLPAKPTPLQLDPTACYWVPGGLGGLGPGIISMMVECGAKHIVTISRSGAKTDKQKAYVRGWEERGCRIDALKCDCTDLEQLEAVIERSKLEDWKIKGVVQLAMVLRDSPFETMTFEKWTTAVRPKIEGTWNLHNLLPKDLDFFINLSSISNIIGNAGQANYVAGNAYQDALAAYRISEGLRGASINVGLMSDTEEYGTNEEWFDFLQKNPHFEPLQLKERDFLAVLTACMKGETSDGVRVPENIITGMRDDVERGLDGAPMTAIWATDRKFELRQKPSCEKSARSGGGNNKVKVVELLKAAKTLKEAAAVVEWAVRGNLANAMTADPEDIDPEKPMHAYGVDSLKAVEVRNWVFKEIKTDVSVFDILGQMSISRLAAKMAGNSKLVSADIAKQGQEALSQE